jgi:N-glycosylase/DNA lyase
MQVKGIGPKVSSCIALFGFGRASFFPIDVWMRKVLDKYYPEVTSGEVFGKYAGIAQQYLFYFERYTQST